MELYTIDPTDSNRRETLIETFESFIWTDRYSAYGDLSLVVEPSLTMLSRLVAGVIVGFDESDRAMEIESAHRTEDDMGKTVLTIKGKSLESILESRVAKMTFATPTWDLVGSAGLCVTYMVDKICIQGVGISPADVIPYLTITDLSGTSETLSINVKAGYLYERIKEICDALDLGFRITLIPGLAALNFTVYKGTDRTGQFGVEFSKDLETLSKSSYYVSKEGYKNVAYVFSDNGSRIVTATGQSGVSGLERKVLLVEATDIVLVAGETLNAALDQRGRDALSEHKGLTLFDGVVNPLGMYRYNRDYFLGDLVPLVGDNGERQTMRVTEHIWSCDAEGLKSYPTLSAIGGV